MGVVGGILVTGLTVVLLYRYSTLSGWWIGSISALIFLSKLKPKKKLPIVFGGFAEPEFQKVADRFKQNLESGQEGGGAFTAYYRGRKVVDVWGGYADEEAKLPWRENTVSCFYSATKALGSLCVVYLAERGLLDMKATVATYWPEFAQNGKENVTVEQLLSHQAGLVVIDKKYQSAMIRDNPDELGRILAQQEPNWPLGSGSGYHQFTHGLLIDQLVRRVDPKHRSLGEFFQQEITIPNGIDFHIGLPLSENYRCARNHKATFGWWYGLSVQIPQYIRITFLITTAWIMKGNKLMSRAFGNPTDYTSSDNPELRQLPVSSAFGFGTARSLAAIYGNLANGGLHQMPRILKDDTVSYMNTPQISGQDKFILLDITWGPGVGLFWMDDKQNRPARYIFGHAGAGGQMGMADPHYRLGWAYVTNYFNLLHGFILDHRYSALQDTLYQCVQDLEKTQ